MTFELRSKTACSAMEVSKEPSGGWGRGLQRKSEKAQTECQRKHAQTFGHYPKEERGKEKGTVILQNSGKEADCETM